MTDSMTEAQLRARIASLQRWSRTADRSAAMQPAREGLAARFAREVDPDGTLDPADRERRIAAARTAHFSRLAVLSHQSRRAAAEARDAIANSGNVADAHMVAGQLRALAADLDSLAGASL